MNPNTLHPFIAAIAAAFLIALAGNADAVPLNDDLASAAVVGPDLPINVESNNLLATMETGEPNFGGSAVSSVWYQWTAPSTGRVSISAIGADGFQPVIGLFTGNQIAALQELGRNNGSIVSSGLPAPLVFVAQGGTTYRIAISGSGTPSTGSFGFQIRPFDEPSIRLAGFSLSPSSVDVGASAQSVTVGLTVESDQSLFTSGQIEVVLAPQAADASGPKVKFQLSLANRISGNNFNGTYSKIIQIPAYCPTATWVPQIRIGTFSNNQVLTWSPRGEDSISDFMLLPVTGVVVNVQNSGLVDVAAPVVSSVSGLPATADVSSSFVPVTLTIGITDDLAGFNTGAVSLVQSDTGGGHIVTMVSPLVPAQRVSGDAMDGVYEVQFELDSSLADGVYQLNIELRDGLGRIVHFGALGTPLPNGSTHQVTIGPAVSGYAAWAALQDFGPGGLSGLQDDPNQDGISNLLCYAFNIPPYTIIAKPMVPGNGDISGLPAISTVGTGEQLRLRIEYLRRISPNNGLMYQPEFGSSLQNSGPGQWIIHSGDEMITPINGEWQRVVIEDATTGLATRFGRLFVSGTP